MYPDESNLKLRLIDGTEYGIQVEFYVKGGYIISLFIKQIPIIKSMILCNYIQMRSCVYTWILSNYLLKKKRAAFYSLWHRRVALYK